MRPHGALSGACLLLGGVVSTGCSAPIAGDVADASGATTQGVVLVERAVSLSRDPAFPASSTEGAAPVTNVSAKFMRLPAATDPDLAERVVGSPFDLPAIDECMVVSPAADEAATSLSALGTIELLDAGDVTMKIDTLEMPLAARAFPNVGDLVFGVFYTSRDAASDLPAPARYTFESSGSGQLDRFAFNADAPAGPEDVRLGDADLADGLDLEEGVGVPVQWRSPDPGDTARREDLVVVDVTTARGAAVRCAFKDAGRGVIPGSFLRPAALGPLPTSATVAVHRLRQVPFNVPGMDLGEVRFDFSVSGKVSIVSH